MKNTLSALAAVLLFSAAQAQTDTTTQPPATTDTTVVSTLPEHLRGVTSATIRPEHYLPVLGIYRPTSEQAAELTINVDEQNPGLVWIDGLPQGRVKALLRKLPATYKIPAQKTAEGKSVPEGTLVYTPETKELSIFLGKAYNDAEPASIFAEGSKSKGWKYTGVKNDVTVSAPVAAPVQQ